MRLCLKARTAGSALLFGLALLVVPLLAGCGSKESAETGKGGTYDEGPMKSKSERAKGATTQ